MASEEMHRSIYEPFLARGGLLVTTEVALEPLSEIAVTVSCRCLAGPVSVRAQVVSLMPGRAMLQFVDADDQLLESLRPREGAPTEPEPERVRRPDTGLVPGAADLGVFELAELPKPPPHLAPPVAEAAARAAMPPILEGELLRFLAQSDFIAVRAELSTGEVAAALSGRLPGKPEVRLRLQVAALLHPTPLRAQLESRPAGFVWLRFLDPEDLRQALGVISDRLAGGASRPATEAISARVETKLRTGEVSALDEPELSGDALIFDPAPEVAAPRSETVAAASVSSAAREMTTATPILLTPAPIAPAVATPVPRPITEDAPPAARPETQGTPKASAVLVGLGSAAEPLVFGAAPSVAPDVASSPAAASPVEEPPAEDLPPPPVARIVGAGISFAKAADLLEAPSRGGVVSVGAFASKPPPVGSDTPFALQVEGRALGEAVLKCVYVAPGYAELAFIDMDRLAELKAALAPPPPRPQSNQATVAIAIQPTPIPPAPPTAGLPVARAGAPPTASSPVVAAAPPTRGTPVSAAALSTASFAAMPTAPVGPRPATLPSVVAAPATRASTGTFAASDEAPNPIATSVVLSAAGPRWNLHAHGELHKPESPEHYLAQAVAHPPTPAQLAQPTSPLLVRWLSGLAGNQLVKFTTRKQEHQFVVASGLEIRSTLSSDTLAGYLAEADGPYSVSGHAQSNWRLAGRTRAILAEVLRRQLRLYPDTQLAAGLSFKASRSPRLTERGHTLVPALGFSTAIQRTAKRLLDGQYRVDEVINSGAGEHGGWELLYLLDLFDGLEWVEPPVRAVDSANPVHEHWKRVEKMDYFEALGLHWSCSPKKLEGAYQAVRAQYGAGSRAAALAPDIADKIVAHAEQARRALATREGRAKHRRERYPTIRFDFQMEVMAAQAQLAMLRGELGAAKELIEGAQDIGDHADVRQALDRLLKLEARLGQKA